MKVYTFPYGGSFGSGDSWGNTIKIELTNKAAARLEASARKEPRYDLDEDTEINDIYDLVYKKAYNQEIRNIPVFILDERRRDDYHGNKRISNHKLAVEYLEDSSFTVSYPEELQGLEEDSE